MKRTLLFFSCLLASLTMSAQEDLTVEDMQNSGCTALTRGAEGSATEPSATSTASPSQPSSIASSS